MEKENTYLVPQPKTEVFNKKQVTQPGIHPMFRYL